MKGGTGGPPRRPESAMPEPTPSQRAHDLLMQHLAGQGVEAIVVDWREPVLWALARGLGAVALGALFGGFVSLLSSDLDAGGPLLLLGTLLVLAFGLLGQLSRRALILSPTRFRLTLGAGTLGDPAVVLARYGSRRLIGWVDEALTHNGAVPLDRVPPKHRPQTPAEREAARHEALLQDLEQRVAPRSEAGAVSLVEQDGELAVVPERVTD